MTVSSETSKSGPYNGNGVTTIFDYKFKIVDEHHLAVIKRDTSGVETTLEIDTDYTVTGVGNPVGGQIVSTSAPATGETITLLRDVPIVQETDLENQGAYYAETVEEALDLAAMRDQQLQEQITRSVKIPASADASALDTLIADIVRLGDSADSIDTVAGNIDDVVLVADHMSDIQAAPGAAATATAAAGVATGAGSTAVDARDAAVVAKNVAEASASDALASKNAAQNAEAVSIDAKNQAQSAAGAAQGSAGAAAGSAAAALASENTAVANAEATSDDRAAVATDRAAVADDKDVAAGAASTAISSANAAQASEEKADKWANNPEDDPVEPGKFSAYHWSEKAKTIAGGGVQTVAEAADGHVAIDLTDPAHPVFDLKPDTITAILGSLRWTRAIGAAEDLNTIKEPGIYTQNQNAGASGGSNYPEALAGMLVVLPGGASSNVRTVQFYVARSSPVRVHWRMEQAADTWYGWVSAFTWDAALVSQGVAEAGTSTDANVKWSPLRVRQAIEALAPRGSVFDRQEFSASGTWTPPTGILPTDTVRVHVWGAGGGGGNGSRGGGGGGGAYNRVDMPANRLPGPISIIVGAGGTPGSGSGGSSSFGDLVFAHGGYTGSTGSSSRGYSGGGGGGIGSPGNAPTTGSSVTAGSVQTGGGGSTNEQVDSRGGGGGGAGAGFTGYARAGENAVNTNPGKAGGDSFTGGAGGGGSGNSSAGGNGGNSVYGGGGGGGGSTNGTGLGGLSFVGGNGGNSDGQAGFVPGGGGGGGGSANNVGGPGGDGLVIVEVIR